MKTMEIESWALRILQRVESHAPVEDSRVEIKANWPDARKTARKLAGHANSARGERILWLIGADETLGVGGADYQELSNWLSSLHSQFDGVPPSVDNLNVEYKGKTVAAMCFETSQAPYVVKNLAFGQPAGGPVEFEVPWREGTKTRSARHNDLVLMLAPAMKMPRLEVLDGRIQYQPGTIVDCRNFFDFSLTVYVAPVDNAVLTFPFHKCDAAIEVGRESVFQGAQIKIDSVIGKAAKVESYMRAMAQRSGKEAFVDFNGAVHKPIIQATSDEIVIWGAGKMVIEGRVPTAPLAEWDELNLNITLVEAAAEWGARLTAKFSKQRGALVWTLCD